MFRSRKFSIRNSICNKELIYSYMQQKNSEQKLYVKVDDNVTLKMHTSTFKNKSCNNKELVKNV